MVVNSLPLMYDIERRQTRHMIQVIGEGGQRTERTEEECRSWRIVGTRTSQHDD